MNNIKLSLVFVVILLLSGISSYAQLNHPGGWLNETDLSRVREKVASGEEPWATAWNEIRNERTRPADVSSTITDRGALQSQGQDAFLLAIKWVVTGDQDFATEGIDILDAWVNTVTRFDIDDTTLRIGIGSNMMANAAEILAHGFNGEAGWPRSRVNAAKTWFKDVVYPITTNGRQRSMNWGTSCVAGNMSMAIFCDNMTMFNDAVDAYKFGFTNTDDGCAGVTQYIVNEEGQCFESERDQGHTQGGIAHLVEPAMIAWNQGVDLVSYSNNRLVAGMEYTAKYNLFNDVPFEDNVSNPCNMRFGWMDNGFISEEDRGDYSPIYVMANTLFEYANIDHPYTNEVASLARYFPEPFNSDHPGMGHLLYSVTNTPTPDGTLVHMKKRNAPNFAIDGGNDGENGQNLKLWASDTANENQRWIEIDRGNDFYSYQKEGTNFCIDGNGGGENGQNVYLWACSTTNQNQHWRKESVGGNAFKLIKRNSTQFALNGGAGGANDQNIDLGSSNGTSQDLHWIINPVNVLSTDDIENDLQGVTIHPNPVNDILNITLDNIKESKVSILNLTGQVVYSGALKKGNNKIQLETLGTGMYVLKIVDDKQVYVQKIIIE